MNSEHGERYTNATANNGAKKALNVHGTAFTLIDAADAVAAAAAATISCHFPVQIRTISWLLPYVIYLSVARYVARVYARLLYGCVCVCASKAPAFIAFRCRYSNLRGIVFFFFYFSSRFLATHCIYVCFVVIVVVASH